MKEYILSIINRMVDFPDEIEINETKRDNKTIVFVVKANKKDIGKLIGKKGKNASAIRTLINAVGAKNDQKIMFEIKE